MDLDSLIDKIVEYKGESRIPYIERFSKKWISSVVEEIQEIQSIEKKLMIYDQKGVDIFSFVRVFLNVIHHEEDETLYLTVALIDLFRNICDAYDLETFVKSKDILNYLVDNFLARTNQPHIVPKRKLPEQKMFNTEPSRVREIDLEAPIVYGDIEDNIKRLQKAKMISDSTDHKNNVIKKACFASEVRKMFVLDSLSDNICVFNLNCVLEKRVTPKSAKDKKDIVILDFCWSSPQSRLGATLKDFSLTFWEAEDNYTFEKTFSIVNYVTDHQARIWYIEFLNLWITTDRTNSLHAWDIATETKMFSLASPHIKSIILDVIPIQMLKLVAVSSLDRMVTIWNFRDKRVVMKLDLTLGGIHTMFWSNHYQVLVTAGFENIIKIWDLNAISLDTSLMGKLIGHISMISAVEQIENTPMIVSADDSGHIKIWDIRSLKCIQTVQLDARIPINKLIGVYEYGKIAFVGSRLHFMEFEGVKPGKKTSKQAEQVWPIKVEYDNMENQIILCTSKDVRIIDVQNGRMKKIYAGLLESEEDDISAFRFLHHNKNFLLGDDRGHLGIYSTNTGEKVKSLAPHDNEVTGLKVDYQNKLIISSSIGSVVHIQKESKNGHQIIRKIENMHFGKELTLLEVSVYHSLIISASNNNSVSVWDYEDAKIIADIQIFANSEPTCIHIINQYAIIIIADSLGKLHFLHFKRREASYISFVKIAELDINSKRIPTPSDQEISQAFVSKLFVDFELDENEIKAKSCLMYISTNKGDMRIYNILEIIQHRSIISVPHASTKANYNCYRVIEEDFLEMVQKYKIYVFNFEAPDGRDFFHTSVSDFNTFPSLDTLLVNEVKAHNDMLTVLSTALFSDKRLITASLDCYIKIWTLEGTLLGSLNINHPLPIAWDSNIPGSTKYKQKIFYALKILDGILRKNKTEMFLNEEKKISVNAFLEKLYKIDSLEAAESKTSILANPSSFSKKNKIILMKDEYAPRDLQFQKAKKIYQQEIRGHSLKQMEILNRLVKAQKNMTERTRQDSIPYKETKNFERQAEEERAKQEFMHFLLNDAKDGKKRRFETLESNPLAKKLEKAITISANHQAKRETIDTNNDSPRSVYSLQKPRHLKANESSVKNTVITSSDNQSFSKKLSHMQPSSLSLKPISIQDGSETPSPRSPRFVTQLSSLRQKSMEDKTVTKRDFYLYAKRKIDTGNDLILPPLSNSSSTKASIAITSSDRKSQKKNFSQIINKLNEAKKKSKYTAGGYQLKPLYKLPRDEDSQDPSSSSRSKVDEPTYNHIQQRSHVDLLPSSSSFETARKKENFASFLDELKDTRKQVEESWNLSADRALHKPSEAKATFNHISKYNGGAGNSNQYQLFVGRPSLKLAEKLSIPISGESFDMNTIFNATSTHSLTNQVKSYKNLDSDYYNL